ncbi:MAG: hypothetical protein ACYDG5_01825 [Dehalococcoidales bacterium]
MKNLKEKKEYRVEIPVNLDVDAVVKRLRTGRMGDRLGDIAVELAETARKLARPRAIYQIAHPNIIDDVTVEIDGATFKSKVLNKLLRNQDTVYPFITTIGKELDELPIAPQEMMKNFALDNIKTVILVNAVDYLTEYIKQRYDIPKAALLNPGEIEDWGITQQKPLFSLFDDAENQIGVTLTSGGVMKPIKSRSGFIFANDMGFLSCQLCTQLKCPGRRAKFDPELQKQYLA